MSSRLDAALRKLVEAGIPLEDLNPEVLSRDYGDPRFSRRPMQPESKPFMGDWVPALADKIGSGIGGAARWVDKNVPSMGGPVDAELLASLIQPLRGSDLGATGTHAGDVYPGAPKAAGMVIGPAAAFAPKAYKAVKRLFGGADEAVDQLKLPGTARTKAPKTSTKPKVRIDAIEEALQADLPLSLYYKNLAEVSGYTDNIAVNQPERYSYIFDETMDSMRPYHQPAMKTKEQFYKFLDFKVTNSKMDEIHDVFREIRDYAQRTLMGEPTDLESFLPNTKWKGKPVERSVEPSATPSPKKEQKKKLTPKEIRAKKDKATIKKEQEAVRPNKLFSDSLDHDLEIRELSRTQYDELINDGWKHQDIMNEHPVIPYSVRRKGREWLELDSSPTPKTADDLLEAVDKTGKGQCFPYCKRRAEEAIKSGENIKIVQGTYSMPKGARKPNEVDMPHVWVEKDNLIQDWQTMELPSGSHFAGKGIPKKMWDDPAIGPYLQEFVPHFEFTPEEWIKITDEFGELGPFTVEEISRVLGK